MEVRLKNSTSGHVTVDVDLTDTPLQVINKAIEQLGDDAMIIMRSVDSIDDINSDEDKFAIDTADAVVPLEFGKPIIEQAKDHITKAQRTGRQLEFIVARALI